MESTVPLLNPEQIEEVNHMILGISEENKKKLDELLAEIVEIENTSILSMRLYKNRSVQSCCERVDEKAEDYR